jgi:hypothetical protein
MCVKEGILLLSPLFTRPQTKNQNQKTKNFSPSSHFHFTTKTGFTGSQDDPRRAKEVNVRAEAQRCGGTEPDPRAD